MIRGLFALSLGLLALPVHATAGKADKADKAGEAIEGLEWDWDGRERRYLVSADVHVAEVLMLRQEINNDVRIARFRLDFVTTCGDPRPTGGSGWEISCSIDDLALQLWPLPSDVAGLPPLIAEYDQRMNASTVVLSLTRSGRLRNVGLKGLERHNRRSIDQVESIRQFFGRAFAAFDLHLPKKGNDKGLGEWKQNHSAILGFPTDVGTVGNASMVHKVTSTEGGRIALATSAHGTVGTAETIDIAGQEQIANLYNMQMAGEAVFDVGQHALVSRQYFVQGVPTSSSQMGDGWDGVPYTQAVSLQLLEPNAPLPKIGESKARRPPIEDASAP